MASVSQWPGCWRVAMSAGRSWIETRPVWRGHPPLVRQPRLYLARGRKWRRRRSLVRFSRAQTKRQMVSRLMTLCPASRARRPAICRVASRRRDDRGSSRARCLHDRAARRSSAALRFAVGHRPADSRPAPHYYVSAPEPSSTAGDPELQRFAGSIARLREARQSNTVPQTAVGCSSTWHHLSQVSHFVCELARGPPGHECSRCFPAARWMPEQARHDGERVRSAQPVRAERSRSLLRRWAGLALRLRSGRTGWGLTGYSSLHRHPGLVPGSTGPRMPTVLSCCAVDAGTGPA